MQITFRPLTVWPGKTTKERTSSRFKARYAETIKLLERELDHLEARSVVIQIAVSERDIRNDGFPRADARPNFPGVIVSFASKHGPLSYPCDTFLDWESNLRAIALALEHLRAVDRYGVTKRGEQYAGWKSLPAPPNGKMSKAEAVATIYRLGGAIATQDSIEDAYRSAALKTHPDRNGGDDAQFKKLQEAKELAGL